MDLSSSSSVNDTQSPGPEGRSSSTPVGSVETLNKMYSKNGNGTAVLTSIPSNDAELQLYRVMQRASLLAYYDTLLEMGGDDVQQLCDAGEEEFLEIMALVGMASKPLHVRRFQKSLQEWMIDPSAFLVPLLERGGAGMVEWGARRGILEAGTRGAYSPAPGGAPSPAPSTTLSSRSTSPSPTPPTPTLTSPQRSLLRSSAKLLSARLPALQPRAPAKRRLGRELDSVLALPDVDPRRMDAIRKYAAIYGRFDCKRRPEKPLTLHEVQVNEAAAQLCGFVPALLTRRDELFPLARQIVRDAGGAYSGGVGNKQTYSERNDGDSNHEDEPPPKKPTLQAKDKANT